MVETDGMKIKRGMIRGQLGDDARMAAQLRAAIAAGKSPTMMLREGWMMASNENMRILLTTYPQTIAALVENKEWLKADIDRALEYLRTLSKQVL